MSARYEISEDELDVLAITGPEGTRYIDGEEIEARVIRQQSADIAELRERLSRPAHAHLDGEHLAISVDGCLLCEAITERDQLRAELAAAVAERDAWRRRAEESEPHLTVGAKWQKGL